MVGLPDLHDEVVRLRAPVEDDAAALTEACQDPDIQRWTALPVPYTREDALKWVAIAALERERGDGFHLVVVDAVDGRLVGAVGIHLRRNTSGEPFGRAGYWVAAPERGRGIATRALDLLSEWALAELGIDWIELSIDPDNMYSRDVAIRAGYELDHRGTETLRGQVVELDRYVRSRFRRAPRTV